MSFPLSWEESDDAQVVLERITEKLAPEAALRFDVAYQECLKDLCHKIPEDIERGFPPTPNEDASLSLSRPTYSAKFETTRTRARRSSVGVWYVFFWLLDGDGDRIPETLQVVGVRHGSAPPQWSEGIMLAPSNDENTP